MMLFTHVLIGILLGAVTSLLASGSPGLLVLAGAIGGGFPDLDMLLVHRRSLHFPVLYSVSSVVLIGAAVVTGSGPLLVAAIAFLAAALHSLMDVLGGGKEMRPWRETDDRAVYDHIRGRWVTPLRVFYDGSVPDLGLAVASGAIAAWILPSEYDAALVALVALGTVYVLFRRLITRRIPERYPTFSAFIQSKLSVTADDGDDTSDQT